jgi:hypothetical protein
MKNVFSKFINFFRDKAKKFPDKRFGDNVSIKIEDIVLSAFSIFHMQSPSFLQFQTNMKNKEGKSNAESMFGIEKIPSDNHIRNILDRIAPSYLRPMYDEQLKYIKETKILDSYKYMGKYPVVLDATEYYSSKKIHCEKCLTKTHNKKTTYSHQAITPIIVSPSMSEIIPLMPEFIRNKDGSKKQDCEINASKRWLKRDIPLDLSKLILGDDLYSREPLCQDILEKGDSFLFVAKRESHKIMYEHIDYKDKVAELETKEKIVGKAHEKEIWKYKFVNKVPINGSKDALLVNWLELEIFDAKTGDKIYINSFITDMKITKSTVHKLGFLGRKRWKIENENNNVLKTKGYHLEHNFGHGKEHLAEFLLALNILAFLSHIVLDLLDETYAKARAKVPRERFFQDMETLTSFIYFFSWEILIAFMARDRDSPLLAISDLMDISVLRNST